MTTYTLQGAVFLVSGSIDLQELTLVLPDPVTDVRFRIDGYVGDNEFIDVDFIGGGKFRDESYATRVINLSQPFAEGTASILGLAVTSGSYSGTALAAITLTENNQPLSTDGSNLRGFFFIQLSGDTLIFENQRAVERFDDLASGVAPITDLLTARRAYALRDLPGISVTENDDFETAHAGRRVYAGVGDDRIVGNGGNETIGGGSGNDLVTSGKGNKYILGGEGDDTLFGGSGKDSIEGESGDDRLQGGAYADKLDGGDGDDLLLGGNGNDHMVGGDGIDTLEGGRNDDRLFGEDGDDRLSGGKGSDRLGGGRGNDTLTGDDGADKIRSGSGNDSVSGGRGADWILGSKGADQFDGGRGNDSLYAGQGADTLKGGSGDDLIVLGGGIDVILFGRSHGSDTVYQFKDNRDELHLYDNLWSGDLSPQEVVARFAEEADGKVRLDFGRKGSITIHDFEDPALLVDDIVIV